ncbi:hypothetical protein [Acetobacter oeni]|uniref:Uncharacterized protein n=1 Tax=Acetobacter oeni TaxID=304077 RepID=A0A511XJX1_9PROT|nr:hypothetical protein [Acetobacter oeni]MBB3883449.1 hypothetical protein [Acetobacter oeni]NHO19419.1 hypothetical protein [Acetobacter oeni]GBR04044.1 hypothetical protein AA21952_1278 [Acetobacter oeni LMG 21952]GEN63229.1 hypothetical protein AOE01nite_14530 [Acetobacter oeni]
MLSASFLTDVSDSDRAISVAGPGTAPVDLLFRPLWPLIVPTTQWRGSLKEARAHIPDTLTTPLTIWILDCCPDADLVMRLIASGDGGTLPDRDPLAEPEWADPVQRAGELLRARAADVLSRPVPAPVLEEMADTAGMKTSEICGLLPSLAVIFAEASLLLPRGSSPVPTVVDRDELLTTLTRIARAGLTAWAFAMPLLLASRNEIDVVLPAARAVALSFAEKGRYVGVCDDALAEIFPLFEARCETVVRELQGEVALSRKTRRTTLWLDVPDLATVLSLVNFANRCSVHMLAAAKLKTAAARASRLQFDLVTAEDLLVSWPRSSWPDSLMVAFERGNRRLRNLATIGGALSRPADYRAGPERMAAYFLEDTHLGLSLVERMRTAESLVDSSQPSSLLSDYLAMLPPPADERPTERRKRRDASVGLQPWQHL